MGATSNFTKIFLPILSAMNEVAPHRWTVWRLS